ncbi:glycosyltransferase family 2 protein [Shewanella sp. MEBiC00475]|uniref:glycosyltransferase family 2 protein n=1 Tax=Shewanella sp. MEBiC00475 TaxID=2575361 RepID=UPI0010BF9826|nr:glycosyltransferase family 2 protein [Shewanella sp. MEBiC00475]
MEPLVSIIMPSYNSARTIAQSIDSVLAQSYSNWELLITDDKSNDDTVSLINQYVAKDARIHLFQNTENLGAGGSRNRSIEEANGKYIAFLDSDDLWLANKLAVQINYMLQHQITLSYAWYQKFSDEGDGGCVESKLTVTYQQLLYGNVIGCLTAVYDAEILGKRYMPLIRKRQDMGLWLDILKDIDMAHAIPKVLAKYRVDSGMTQNKLMVLKWQWLFYRQVLNFGIIKSTVCFFVYAIKGFVKYFT